MQYGRNPLSLTTIALTFLLTFQALAQTTWINAVPGYSSLAPCAETRLSSIVRDQVSGCGMPTSHACFCSTSYATMNTIIAKAVYSDCNNGADTNSALSVFADYCGSSPVITLSPTSSAIAQAIATAASPPVAVSSPTPSSTPPAAQPSSTSPANPSTFSTYTRSDSKSISSSSISSGASVSGSQTSGVTATAGTAPPSSSCCSNTSHQSSSSAGLSKGVIAGISIGGTLFLVIAYITFVSCRARRNTDSATEISPLLEKARSFRDTNPKTKDSVTGEEASLHKLIDTLPESQECYQFDYKRGLIENALDQLEISPAGQDALALAIDQCNDLQDLSTRIRHDRTSASFFVQFYKGLITFTQARLVQLNDPAQAASQRVEDLYADAFREFAAAVQRSEDSQMSQCTEVRKYRIRSLHTCAFIVTQFARLDHLEGDLMVYPEYIHAKGVLKTAHEAGNLLGKIVTLDNSYFHFTNDRRHASCHLSVLTVGGFMALLICLKEVVLLDRLAWLRQD